MQTPNSGIESIEWKAYMFGLESWIQGLTLKILRNFTGGYDGHLNTFYLRSLKQDSTPQNSQGDRSSI